MHACKKQIPLAGEPDLGLSSNIVIRLCREIPRNMNYKFFLDNYYTSMGLISYLHKNGILSLGTVRRNILSGCKMPPDRKIRKKQRGWTEEFVCCFDDVELSNVAWLDNRPVMLLPSILESEKVI